MRVAILAALLCVTCGRKADAPVEPNGLPGAEPRDAATERQLSEALARRGAWYKPHTRHLRSDGSPRFTNRLILENSPYLVAHAHNPVDWYPWGDAAFAAAAAANKPVLLSIGYSTCHWCHVMAEESFEDEAIAATINRYFIAIKVDREERPDLDAVYMEAVQKFGDGGWPMTVFLLPDRRPFFGTTYLPPRDHMRGNPVGLATLLDKIHDAYLGDRAKLTEQARMVAASLAAREPTPTAMPSFGTLREQVQQLTASYDKVWGGFGPAPKFPRPAAIDLLLRFYRRTGDWGALDMAAHTLDRIAAGGIRDQVGGGFHRYSTDARWRVPHFEKMLYDNAQLVVVYLAALQLLSRPQDAVIARDTLDYLLRDMRSPEGGFYAASDADSGGEEGTYFTWTAAEIDRAIGPSSRIAREAFDVTVGGNWQGGRNILWRPQSDTEVANRLGISVEDVAAALATARERLAVARAKRAAPAIDRKILVGWNGLAITAFARGALVLDEPRYKDAAITCANLLLDRAKGAHELVDGKPSGTAFLDDTALLEAGLLDLYEADPDPRWLRAATELQDTLDRNFGTTGPYSFTPTNHEKLLAPVRANLDDPIPSGNAVAVQNLLRLHQLLDEDRYRTRANQILPTLSNPAAIDFAVDRPKQIVIVGDPTELLAKLRTVYVPNRVIVQVLDGKPSPSPLAEGKTARGGKPTAYVCIGTHCELPTTDSSVFATQLKITEPLP